MLWIFIQIVYREILHFLTNFGTLEIQFYVPELHLMHSQHEQKKVDNTQMLQKYALYSKRTAIVTDVSFYSHLDPLE